MQFDDLGAAWHAGDAARATPTPESLRQIRARAEELDRLVRRRDRVETITALLMLVPFGWAAAVTTSTTSRAGALLIMAACLLIPVRLRLARQGAPELSLPLALFLAEELARVRAQVRLLRSVFWWYLAPLGTGVVLFVAGRSPSPWLTAGVTLVVLLLYAALWRLNQQAVERHLLPRAEELERGLAGLAA